MKRLLVLILVSALTVFAGGCSGGGAAGTSRTVSSASTSPTTANSSNSSSRNYLNDGDAEKVNDRDGDNGGGNHDDTDADSAEEYEEGYDNGSYHDSDDARILSYGHLADGALEDQLMAMAEEYFAVAAEGNGSKACSMLLPQIAKSVVEDYGQSPPGPKYLDGSKTCGEVMSRLFRYLHRQLSSPVEATSVRVSGNQAYAFVGSKTMAAGRLTLLRVGGKWKVGGLAGGPLP